MEASKALNNSQDDNEFQDAFDSNPNQINDDVKEEQKIQESVLNLEQVDQLPDLNNDKTEDSAPQIYDIEKARQLKEEANKMFKQQDYSQALILYDQAISLCPPEEVSDLAIFYNNKGICYRQMDLKEEAKDAFTKSIETLDTYVKPRYQRLLLLKDKEEYEQALEDAKKIKELDPQFQGINSLIAELEQLQKEKFEKMKNEVLGNLKNLGNMFLGKFGMSLDNFKLNQNPDGTYNVQYGNQKQ